MSARAARLLSASCCALALWTGRRKRLSMASAWASTVEGEGPLCTSALVLLKQFQTHQSPSDPAHRAWRYSSPHSAPGVSVACYEVRSASIELGVLCRYDKFAFDITDALEKGVNGVHEVAVRVIDPTG